MIKLRYSRDRLDEAKDIYTRWYLGQKTERLPYVFSVSSEHSGMMGPNNPYTYGDMCRDGVKAVEGQLSSIQYRFDTFPDCDYIPYIAMHYMGEGILASMYGAEQLIVEDNPPFTKGRLFKSIYETEKLSNDFEVEQTEWGKKLKEHITIAMEATDGEIPVGGIDFQSPYGTATKLLGNEELMMAMYDEPELVHNFLSVITEGIMKLIDTVDGWMQGGLYAHNISLPVRGAKSLILWDDYVSVLNPSMHMEFCVPYNRKLYERYGDGHYHTCGPYFPSYIDACIANRPRSLDVSIMRGMGRSRADLEKFLSVAEENGIRMFGGVTVNETSIFDGEVKYAGDELFARFVRGGLFPSSSGSYEDGLKFVEKVRDIQNGAI